MSTKKSIVKLVTSNGTWQSKRDGKTFYKYEIEMENGDAGEYSSISEDQDKFVAGTEAEYIFVDGDYPKIKPSWNTINSTANYNPSYDNRENGITKSVALKSATEYAVRNDLDLSELLKVAEKMESYLKGDTISQTTEEDKKLPF